MGDITHKGPTTRAAPPAATRAAVSPGLSEALHQSPRMQGLVQRQAALTQRRAAGSASPPPPMAGKKKRKP